MFDIQSIYQVRSVDDAIAQLVANPQAIVIAGGTDILIDLHHGKKCGCDLVSIHDLEELKGISINERGDVVIGALSTFRDVTFSPIIREKIPYLGQATDQAGGPQLRAVGTIGGNVCNGITSADSASTLVALDAQLHLKGQNGWRMVPISQWYEGVGKTARGHDEILVKIVIKKENYVGWSGHYIKYAQRNAMDIATLGVACLVKLSADKTVCDDVRLAFGVAAPVPVRAMTAEGGVKGLGVAEAVAKIGALALDDVNPRTSWRASKEYRIHLIRELSARGLAQAIVNGGGEVPC